MSLTILMFYTDPIRAEFPEQVSRRPLSQALEQIAAFCLEGTAADTRFSVKHVPDFAGSIVVATECLSAPGIEYDEEYWVSRLRISTGGCNPFSANSGLEFHLPFGANRNLCDPFDEAVTASYPFDGIGWTGHDLRLNIQTATVGELDRKLSRGRPESSDEWVGFYLGNVLQAVDNNVAIAAD